MANMQGAPSPDDEQKTALERYGGNVSETARALGLHRQSLQKMLRRLGIEKL